VGFSSLKHDVGKSAIGQERNPGAPSPSSAIGGLDSPPSRLGIERLVKQATVSAFDNGDASSYVFH
jgi:hypothetical protein